MYTIDLMLMDALCEKGDLQPVDAEMTAITYRGSLIGKVANEHLVKVKEACFTGFFHDATTQVLEIVSATSEAVMNEVLEGVRGVVVG